MIGCLSSATDQSIHMAILAPQVPQCLQIRCFKALGVRILRILWDRIVLEWAIRPPSSLFVAVVVIVVFPPRPPPPPPLSSSSSSSHNSIIWISKILSKQVGDVSRRASQLMLFLSKLFSFPFLFFFLIFSLISFIPSFFVSYYPLPYVRYEIPLLLLPLLLPLLGLRLWKFDYYSIARFV